MRYLKLVTLGRNRKCRTCGRFMKVGEPAFRVDGKGREYYHAVDCPTS